MECDLSFLEVLLGDRKHNSTGHYHDSQNNEDHVQDELESFWCDVAVHLHCIGAKYRACIRVGRMRART